MPTFQEGDACTLTAEAIGGRVHIVLAAARAPPFPLHPVPTQRPSPHRQSAHNVLLGLTPPLLVESTNPEPSGGGGGARLPNLLCRLPKPRAFLDLLPALLHPMGPTGGGVGASVGRSSGPQTGFQCSLA